MARSSSTRQPHGLQSEGTVLGWGLFVCLFVDHFYTVKRIVTLGLWQRCNDCKENSNVRAVAAV